MDKLEILDSKKDPGVFIEWAAEDRRVVAYPCANNTIFNLCAFMPSSEAAVPEKGGKFAFNSRVPHPPLLGNGSS
jgi:hypothetical protein